MMDETQESPEWKQLLRTLRQMCEDYPDLVVIGGVAVWMHTLRMADVRLLQASHDADFYLSMPDFGTIRDIEEVVPNRRLGPCPIVIRETLPLEEGGHLLSIEDLCARAGVPLRVSGPDVRTPRILISTKHPTGLARLSGKTEWIAVISTKDILRDAPDLRVLEILAHGFFDYSARECLCRGGIFSDQGVDDENSVSS